MPALHQSQTASRPWNGRYTFYHPNKNGTGMAARFELKLDPLRRHGGSCFFLEMARQKTAAAGPGQDRVPATFDWSNKATVKLGFLDLCEFLAVLETRQEQAGGARKGLYHATGAGNTLIGFGRNAERGGYGLSVSRKDRAGSIVFRGHILLSEAEGIGLKHIFQHGIFHLAFHESLLPAES
ncbi:MAG: hypothetical protein JW951_04765 [Lentisphaerae bacterium]|nr:hypothetical protein [Lentisphaerota bacterium]